MLRLALIWLVSASLVLLMLVLVRTWMAGGFAQWRDRNWRSIVALALIAGALPAFLLDYFASRRVDLPPGLDKRPTIVERPN